MAKTRFTYLTTTNETSIARVVNYQKKHNNIAKTAELEALVKIFAEKCNANSAPSKASAIANYDTSKWGENFTRPVHFIYHEGESKHEGFAKKNIGGKQYRLDFQGYVEDCGYRANIALQWGSGNDGVNGGAAGSLLVECGTTFSQKSLLYALKISIWNQAKVYVSQNMAAKALEKKQEATGGEGE